MSSINLNQHSLSIASGLSRLQPITDAISARVSSGKRIDKPSVDVAGAARASKLDSQQAGLRAVETNLQNGVSRMQVGTSQLDTIAGIVTRMSEIATLNTNSTQSTADRALYQTEFAQLQGQLRQTIGGTTAEIGGATDVTNPLGAFGGTALFGPGPGETLTIGLHSDERLTLPVMNFRTGALGDLIHQDASGAYTTTIENSQATLGASLDQTSGAQALVGSVQSRLEFAAGVAVTASTNHEAALSVIRDADIAADSTALARLQILSESHTAMLAQARDTTGKLISLLSRN
ncbi:MAG: flagellin [Opitutaceae bacterium]|jgi:flagellin